MDFDSAILRTDSTFVNMLLVRTSPPLAMDAAQARAVAALGASDASRVAAVLRAMADPVRVRILAHLSAATQRVCVCDLPDLGVSQPTVSHHLRRLREAGLVDCERRATWVYYRVTEAGRVAVRALTELADWIGVEGEASEPGPRGGCCRT